MVRTIPISLLGEESEDDEEVTTRKKLIYLVVWKMQVRGMGGQEGLA